MRMPRMRTTIARLMSGMALFSIGLACLMYASTPWARAALSLTLGILTFAILGAVLRQGQRRAYWTGFAVCGWIYLVLSNGPWYSTTIRDELVTTELLTWAYPMIVPESRRPEGFAKSNQVVAVPNPTLGAGVTMGTLSSTVRRVDVWAKNSDGTKSILAEDAKVAGLSNSDNRVTQVKIIVHGNEYNDITQAQADRASFTLEVYEPGVFSGLRSSPPVRERDFQFVGHPLFALLFAWLGSIAGRFLATPSVCTGSARPD